MILRIRAGQSTLEYAIILVVVIGAIIGAAIIFRPALTGAYNMLYPNASQATGAGTSGATGNPS